MAVISLATSVIINLDANIVITCVIITMEYCIAPRVTRGILNTCVAIISKIPTYGQWLPIITIPKFRQEIFPEHIIGLRKGFKSHGTTVAFTHLHFVAVVRLASSIITNLHADIVATGVVIV